MSLACHPRDFKWMGWGGEGCWVIASDAQYLFLTLLSGSTPGGSWRTIWDAQTQAKPNLCITNLALNEIFFNIHTQNQGQGNSTVRRALVMYMANPGLIPGTYMVP